MTKAVPAGELNGYVPPGKEGSVQIVSGEIAHVLFKGNHVNRRVHWAYLNKIPITDD